MKPPADLTRSQSRCPNLLAIGFVGTRGRDHFWSRSEGGVKEGATHERNFDFSSFGVAPLQSIWSPESRQEMMSGGLTEVVIK